MEEVIEKKIHKVRKNCKTYNYKKLQTITIINPPTRFLNWIINPATKKVQKKVGENRKN